MKKLAEKLKEHNLKATPQRIAIFDMLCSTSEHPSADTIYKALSPVHTSMSLATVYKTLDALKNAHLIQILNVGEDSFRYDANTKIHPHAVCVDCHRVYDIDIDLNSYIENKINTQTDFKFIEQQTYCYVKCSECQE